MTPPLVKIETGFCIERHFKKIILSVDRKFINLLSMRFSSYWLVCTNEAVLWGGNIFLRPVFEGCSICTFLFVYLIFFLLFCKI